MKGTNSLVGVDQYLLKSIAEELRLPLIQISRLAELNLQNQKIDQKDIKKMESSADLAIQLLESFILGVEYSDRQIEIELSPITIGAVLNDVAHQVNKLATANNYDIELSVKSAHPVMGNYEAIKMAYLNIAHTIITGSTRHENNRRSSLVFAVYNRGPKNMAGIYSNNLDINKNVWERSINNFEKSRQKMPEFSHINGSGFFVASSILEAMSLELGPSKFHGDKGLAAGFPLSQQLQLV